MHRSSGSFRPSDEYLLNLQSSVTTGSPLKVVVVSSADCSDGSKKEVDLQRQKLAGENAVHLIPLVIFLCGFVLWLFSRP
ncbi:hypothetical protein LINGRAHAP2_LOCUS20752 [Linum grandiflorum]